jgi:hypothetical protein
MARHVSRDSTALTGAGEPAGITDDRAKLNAQTPNSVLSHISVAELHFGATMANWGERSAANSQKASGAT